MAPTTAAKKTRVSRSTRAGIIFPVARMHRLLKAAPTATTRVTKAAAVYLASAVEYLVGESAFAPEHEHFHTNRFSSLSAELLELSGNAAHDYRRTRIIPRHILLAVANDEELSKVNENVHR